jgi:hypothetical protein
MAAVRENKLATGTHRCRLMQNYINLSALTRPSIAKGRKYIPMPLSGKENEKKLLTGTGPRVI